MVFILSSQYKFTLKNFDNFDNFDHLVKQLKLEFDILGINTNVRI